MARDRKFKLHDGKGGAAITIHVTPRAKQNQIKEILEDGTIHLFLTSSKEDQEINKGLIDFLSQLLGIKSGEIEIIGGQHGLDKLITILNIDAETLQSKITNLTK